MLIPFTIIAVFIGIAFITMYLWQSVINTAITKYVKPELAKKGFVYGGYESVESFSTGDFNRTNDDNSTRFTFLYTNGNSSSSLYFYVYYKTPVEKKRVTIRIDSIFFFVRRVKFSGGL